MLFDVKIWKDRALNRHKKRSQTAKKKADDQLKVDLITIDQMKTVIDWCETKSLNVTFGKYYGAVYDPVESMITISSQSGAEFQLYMLLHEIGHYLVNTCGSSRARSSRGYVLDTTDHTMHYKVDLIEEEYDAWDRGRKLSKRLKLNIDINAYNRYKVHSLKTYFQWAVSNKK